MSSLPRSLWTQHARYTVVLCLAATLGWLAGPAGLVLAGATGMLAFAQDVARSWRCWPTYTEDIRQRAAWHEAGHAVALWALPEMPAAARVHLYRRGALTGETQLSDRRLRSRPTEQEMVALLAGMPAEELAFGNLADGGASEDLAAASELALRRATNENGSPTEFLVAAHQQAWDLLEAHHEKIAAVAAALLEHGALTGRALAALLPVHLGVPTRPTTGE